MGAGLGARVVSIHGDRPDCESVGASLVLWPVWTSLMVGLWR